MTWLKFYSHAMCFISWEQYCGPLSLTKVAGISCLAKIDISILITQAEVVLVDVCTSTYLRGSLQHVGRSVSSVQSNPMQLAAMRIEGRGVGSIGCLGTTSALVQSGQCWTRCSTCCLRPGPTRMYVYVEDCL